MQVGRAVFVVQRMRQISPVMSVRTFASEWDPKPLRESELTAMRRGTGGRSSFNGQVVTVFGGTGFLGTHVINKLGKTGSQVVVPYRGEAYDARHLKLAGDLGQVIFIPFNLKDEASIAKAMKYSNVVINLIGREFPTKNYSFDEVHAVGARRIARIAKELGIPKLVHVSALNVYNKRPGVILRGGSKWLASKRRGEEAVLEEFPEAVIIRPSDMWGTEDKFLWFYGHYWHRSWNTNHVAVWNKGIGYFKQPIHVQDVAKAIVKSCANDKTNGQIFQAVGPHRYELSEMLDWFNRCMRRDSVVWGYKRMDLRFSPMWWIFTYLNEWTQFVQPFNHQTWDKFEREVTTDTVDYNHPTIEDLGVTLVPMEDRVPFELKYFRSTNYYLEEVGEFDEPAPPKTSPLYD